MFANQLLDEVPIVFVVEAFVADMGGLVSCRCSDRSGNEDSWVATFDETEGLEPLEVFVRDFDSFLDVVE